MWTVRGSLFLNAEIEKLAADYMQIDRLPELLFFVFFKLIHICVRFVKDRLKSK